MDNIYPYIKWSELYFPSKVWSRKTFSHLKYKYHFFTQNLIFIVSINYIIGSFIIVLLFKIIISPHIKKSLLLLFKSSRSYPLQPTQPCKPTLLAHQPSFTSLSQSPPHNYFFMTRNSTLLNHPFRIKLTPLSKLNLEYESNE